MTTARRTATHHGGAAWTPASLPNLVEWWDFSDTSKITSSGGLVSAVATSLASGGHTLSQSTGAQKPTTGANTINGLNVLTADGNRNMATAGVATAQPCTVLAVLNNTGGSIYVSDSSGNNRLHRINHLGSDAYYAGGAAYVDDGSTPTGTHQWVIVFNGSSSVMYRDGSSVASGTAGTGTGTGVTLFSFSGGNTSGLVGYFAEYVLIGSTITPGDRTSWNTYCARWGL